MFIVAPWPAAVHGSPLTDNEQVRKDIFDWIKAWESKDINRYMSHYHPAFRADGKDCPEWGKRKKKVVQTSRPDPRKDFPHMDCHG